MGSRVLAALSWSHLCPRGSRHQGGADGPRPLWVGARASGAREPQLLVPPEATPRSSPRATRHAPSSKPLPAAALSAGTPAPRSPWRGVSWSGDRAGTVPLPWAAERWPRRVLRAEQSWAAESPRQTQSRAGVGDGAGHVCGLRGPQAWCLVPQEVIAVPAPPPEELVLLLSD